VNAAWRRSLTLRVTLAFVLIVGLTAAGLGLYLYRAFVAEIGRRDDIQLLGKLRSEPAPPERAPQPGIAALRDLVARQRAEGLDTTLSVEGVPRALPPGAEPTGSRLVPCVPDLAPPRGFLPPPPRARGPGVAFAAVEAATGTGRTLPAPAPYGQENTAHAVMKPLASPPPPLDSLDPERRVHGDMAPHFTQHVEYRMETGPSIGGGNIGKPAIERLWMRTRDGRPLDEARLCFLLDALYPPAFTVLPQPLGGASVDLRYDILTDPTPELAPDGWVFFEFRMLDLNHGWTVDDVVVWGADGTPIALARQRRKLF